MGFSSLFGESCSVVSGAGCAQPCGRGLSWSSKEAPCVVVVAVAAAEGGSPSRRRRRNTTMEDEMRRVTSPGAAADALFAAGQQSAARGGAEVVVSPDILRCACLSSRSVESIESMRIAKDDLASPCPPSPHVSSDALRRTVPKVRSLCLEPGALDGEEAEALASLPLLERLVVRTGPFRASRMPRLVELRLVECGLESIPRLAEMVPCARVVDVSRNRLACSIELAKSLEGLERLEELIAFSNELSVKRGSLPPWIALGSVSRIDLSHNRLASLGGLELCRGLTDLAARTNRLDTLDSVAALAALPLLERLDLRDNRVATKRLTILALFHAARAPEKCPLPVLDGVTPTRRERAAVACRAFCPASGAPLRRTDTLSHRCAAIFYNLPQQQHLLGDGLITPSSNDHDSLVTDDHAAHDETTTEHADTRDGGGGDDDDDDETPPPPPPPPQVAAAAPSPVSPPRSSSTSSSSSSSSAAAAREAEPDAESVRELAEEVSILDRGVCDLALSLVATHFNVRGLAPDERLRTVRVVPMVDCTRVRRDVLDARGPEQPPIAASVASRGGAMRRDCVLAVSETHAWVFEQAEGSSTLSYLRRCALASLLSVRIGFKLEWLALDFEDDERGGWYLVPNRRSDVVDLMSVLVAPAKIMRAKRLGRHGDAARRATVAVVADDERALEAVDTCLLAARSDLEVGLYASCSQTWGDDPTSQVAHTRLLVVAQKALYLADDAGLSPLLGAASLPTTEPPLYAVESVPWSRARRVHSRDAGANAFCLVFVFVDPLIGKAGILKSYRTWCLCFSDHAVRDSALDLIRRRLLERDSRRAL